MQAKLNSHFSVKQKSGYSPSFKRIFLFIFSEFIFFIHRIPRKIISLHTDSSMVSSFIPESIKSMKKMNLITWLIQIFFPLIQNEMMSKRRWIVWITRVRLVEFSFASASANSFFFFQTRMFMSSNKIFMLIIVISIVLSIQCWILFWPDRVNKTNVHVNFFFFFETSHICVVFFSHYRQKEETKHKKKQRRKWHEIESRLLHPNDMAIATDDHTRVLNDILLIFSVFLSVIFSHSLFVRFASLFSCF